jgi:hypothetical protein
MRQKFNKVGSENEANVLIIPLSAHVETHTSAF